MVPIAVAFTPDYFVPAATMLHSLFRHTDKNQLYTIYCLESEEIPQRQKAKLESMFSGLAQFQYISACQLPPGTWISPRYSAAALYRLMLPQLLPDLDRILYLDCDIIIRRDISSLYASVDLSNKLLAAVHEPPIENQAAQRVLLGIDPDSYFNSGFLILNLALMRQESTTQSLFNLLQDDKLEFPDQDALNIVCQKKVLLLPPYFNSIRTFFIEKYKPEFLRRYSQKEYETVQTSGNIHYTGGKPWNMYSIMFDAWWSEYRMLPAEIKTEWKPGVRIRLLSHICSSHIGKAGIRVAKTIRNILS